MSDTVPSTWDEVFQHERFKQLNTRAKTAEEALEKANGQLATLQASQKTQADELKALRTQLKDAQAGQTDLEKLQGSLTELQSKFEQTQQSLAAEQAQRLRLEVATEKGLPAPLAARLTGTTREELLADAEGLLPLLKPTAPGVPPAPPRTPPGEKFTQQQLSDPDFVRANAKKIMEEASAST